MKLFLPSLPLPTPEPHTQESPRAGGGRGHGGGGSGGGSGRGGSSRSGGTSPRQGRGRGRGGLDESSLSGEESDEEEKQDQEVEPPSEELVRWSRTQRVRLGSRVRMRGEDGVWRMGTITQIDTLSNWGEVELDGGEDFEVDLDDEKLILDPPTSGFASGGASVSGGQARCVSV